MQSNVKLDWINDNESDVKSYEVLPIIKQSQSI